MSLKLVPSLIFVLVGLAFAFPATTRSAPKPPRPALKLYMNKAAEVIGPLWYRAVENNVKNLAVGKVRFTLRITPDGRVENLRIMPNTANRLLASISARSIKDAKLPPVPKNVLLEEGHNWIEVEHLDFTIFPLGY